MNCQDVPSSEWGGFGKPSASEVISQWVVAADNRHLRINDRLLTIEECEIVRTVLKLILGDINLL